MSAKKRWSRRLIVIGGSSLLIIVAFQALALFTPVHEGPVSDHFDGRRFNNIPEEQTIAKSLLDVLRWQLGREPGPWTQKSDVVFYTPPHQVTEDARVTLVNHATVLIQTGGINILTDPIWSKRSSPLRWIGPARYREAGIRFADLPPIDVVLLSHNHYDHMDRRSIRDLAQIHDPLFLVPPGNARYVQRFGAEKVVELDWWQSETVQDIEIHAVPAQHWSRRGAHDTNRALWAGFVIQSDSGPLYFAGDTGMGAHFAEISARLGAPRLAMLPIGAYLPRWFMAKQHIDPEEVAAAHIVMGAQESMAIHFGTFQLGDDGQEEPVHDLRLALDSARIPGAQFWIPGNGESRLIEKP